MTAGIMVLILISDGWFGKGVVSANGLTIKILREISVKSDLLSKVNFGIQV